MSTTTCFYKFQTEEGIKLLSSDTFRSLESACNYIEKVYPNAKHIGMKIAHLNGKQHRQLQLINDAL